MSRNYAKSRSRIQRMCTLNEVKEKDLYEKGKLLLEIYRDVCWRFCVAGNKYLSIKKPPAHSRTDG